VGQGLNRERGEVVEDLPLDLAQGQVVAGDHQPRRRLEMTEGQLVDRALLPGAGDEHGEPLGILVRRAGDRHVLVTGHVQHGDPVRVGHLPHDAARHSEDVVGLVDRNDGAGRSEDRDCAVALAPELRAHVLDVDTVDLADLGDEEVHEVFVGEGHGQLVDGPTTAALQHVDRHDIASDSADAAGHRAQRTGSVW